MAAAAAATSLPQLAPTQTSFLHPPPPPSPARSYFSYDYLNSPPAQATPFRFSFVLLALPVASIVLLFICTYVRIRLARINESELPARNNGGHPRLYHHPPTAALPTLHIQLENLPDRSYIHKLPTFPFSAAKLLNPQQIKLHSHGDQKNRRKEFHTCAVCISEYEESETLKLLPACGHSFHKECIDMWLFSHSTCPLCRLSVFSDKGDLILHDEKTRGLDGSSQPLATDISVESLPSVSSPAMLARSHSSTSDDHSMSITIDALAQTLRGIRRSSSYPTNRDDNRVHPVDSSS